MTCPPIVSFLPLALLAALPSLSRSAHAQQHESRGVLAGAATAVAVDGGLSGGDAEPRLHRNGFSGAATVAFPAANHPPNLQAILAWHGVVGLDVDDISLGRDDVMLDVDGFITVPPSSWGVLSFSLRQGATGEAGSRIADEASLGAIGAALFSYVLPGSVLPSQQVNVVERSHSRQDLGLPAGSEVDAVDFPLILGRGQATFAAFEPGFAAFAGPPEVIYFTVSHATRHLVPASWWSPYTAAQAQSGATVLRTMRTATGAPWSVPNVYCTFAQLGLGQDEDVDALAVQTATQRVMFSVTGLQRPQFLCMDLSADGLPPAPVVVKKPDGTPLDGSVGKGQNDDVDAVCTLDPRILSTGGLPPGGDDFGSSCGAPRAGWLGVPQVHASAFRRFEAGSVFFDSWMVGWPPLSGIGPGFAVPFATIGNDTTLLQIGPIVLRDVLDSRPGNPQSINVALPPNTALTGASITFRWAAVDGALTEIAEAWPVQVRL